MTEKAGVIFAAGTTKEHEIVLLMHEKDGFKFALEQIEYGVYEFTIQTFRGKELIAEHVLHCQRDALAQLSNMILTLP